MSIDSKLLRADELGIRLEVVNGFELPDDKWCSRSLALQDNDE